jgi:hypothetical protein
MRDLNKQERAAIEAVARQFSATWEEGNQTSDADLWVAGRRVAVDVTTIKPRGIDQGDAAKLRLRFDKVATALIERLQFALAETVPAGTTVLLGITAPIRLPAKTAATLKERILTLLERRSPGRDEKDAIHGNRVQILLLRGQSERAPKMIGFVHNPDLDPLLLFNMTRELLGLINAEPGQPAPRLMGDRWLAVLTARQISCLPAYRYIYSQLSMATNYEKILVVFADGRVDTLKR